MPRQRSLITVIRDLVQQEDGAEEGSCCVFRFEGEKGIQGDSGVVGSGPRTTWMRSPSSLPTSQPPGSSSR
jgi:hypothetical protein